MRDSVIFCKVDSYGFPHWNGVGFLRWKTLPTNWRFDTGTAHLWIYKTAWLVYHRNMLKKSAEEAQIPLLLLAGVAAAEVGGRQKDLSQWVYYKSDKFWKLSREGRIRPYLMLLQLVLSQYSWVWPLARWASGPIS